MIILTLFNYDVYHLRYTNAGSGIGFRSGLAVSSPHLGFGSVCVACLSSVEALWFGSVETRQSLWMLEIHDMYRKLLGELFFCFSL